MVSAAVCVRIHELFELISSFHRNPCRHNNNLRAGVKTDMRMRSVYREYIIILFRREQSLLMRGPQRGLRAVYYIML